MRAGPRKGPRAVLAGSLLFGGLTAFSLAATTALVSGTASATPPTLFSSATPGTYSVTVPGGANGITITAVGGSGGAALPFGAGGEGGVTTETVFVNPSDSLAITIGANGQPDTAGGAGGTGYGNGGDGFAGGGGGGGSAVIDSTQGNTPLVVSGGGGGGSELSPMASDQGYPGSAELQGAGADQAGPSADFYYNNGLTFAPFLGAIVGPGAGTLTDAGRGGCIFIGFSVPLPLVGCAASGSGPTGGSGEGDGVDSLAQSGGGGGYEGGGAGFSGGAGGGASYPSPATQWDTTATPSVTITVTPFSIATTSLPAATPGTAYGPVTLQAANLATSTSPYATTLKWKKVTLPKGLKLSSTGMLSGTPNQKLAAPTSVTVQVTEKVTTLNSKGKPVKIKASVQATIPFA